MKDESNIQRGNQVFTRQELETITFPTETKTYKPINHSLIADLIIENGNSVLAGYQLKSEEFFVGRYGRQLAGCITFNKNEQEEGLCIGYRNSYDKSLSVGVCVGIKNPIWDSFAFNGSVVALKKHTQSILASIEEMLIVAVFRASRKFTELLKDLESLKKVTIEDDEVYKTLGLLCGHDILGPRQFTSAVAHWKVAKNDENFSKDLYGLYGICSSVLKSTQPLTFLDNYVNLHNAFLKMLA
ncbi:MAG: hypothetical protein WAV73_04920 [Candidatus Moraniibacteriota bacterium]